MNSEHIQADAVKSYLLGTLPDDRASVIEERYFTDAAFFNEIRRIEIDLICEFLDEELTEDEREQFNRRYMQIPASKGWLTKFVRGVRRISLGRAQWR